MEKTFQILTPLLLYNVFDQLFLLLSFVLLLFLKYSFQLHMQVKWIKNFIVSKLLSGIDTKLDTNDQTHLSGKLYIPAVASWNDSLHHKAVFCQSPCLQ